MLLDFVVGGGGSRFPTPVELGRHAGVGCRGFQEGLMAGPVSELFRVLLLGWFR